MVSALMVIATMVVSAEPQASPFQPLVDHIAKGAWALNNSENAAVFYLCLDSIKQDQDAAIIQFVGDDDDRAYWIPCYLTSPSYLRAGRRGFRAREPRPLLALAIWANFSERLEIGKTSANKRAPNELAAITAKQLGLNDLAITFKRRAEQVRDGGPAISEEDQNTYDSIQLPER